MAREFDTLNVEIEPGMPDGHELLFFEEGEPVIDGEPGDLRMKIVTASDETFRRDGNDLYMTYWIDLVDALTGFSKEFVHFDGHKAGLGWDGTGRDGMGWDGTGRRHTSHSHLHGTS